MSTRPFYPFALKPGWAPAVAVVMGLFLSPPPTALSQGIPAWADSAYALIQADLSRMLADQQTYFSAHGKYATDLQTLGCQSSAGVTMGINARAGGFSAAATHQALGATKGCAVYLGDVEVPTFPLSPDQPGRILCTQGSPAEPLADLRAEQDASPVSTPYDVPPSVRNPAFLLQAMERRYPPVLRDNGVGGTVQVKLHICDRGTVLAAVLEESSGYELLDNAALKVANAIRFTPARYEGSPVDVWVTLPITFTPGGEH